MSPKRTIVKGHEPLTVEFPTKEQAEGLAFQIIAWADNALDGEGVETACATLRDAAPLFAAIADTT